MIIKDNDITTRNRNNRKRGSNLEYRIADKVNGVRVGRSKAVKVGDKWIQTNCVNAPDVVSAWASYECKSWLKVPAAITKTMTQATRNAPEGLIPIGVLYDRTERCTYFVINEHDFLDLLVGEKKE